MIGVNRHDNSWEIIEPLEDPTNEEIHTALALGANGLELTLTRPLTERQILEIFKGIHFEFIELYLSGDQSTMDKIQKLTSKKSHENIFSFTAENFQEELSAFLSESHGWLENSNFSKQPWVSIPMNNQYLANIARIRSIRLLWSHLLTSYELREPVLKIIATAGQHQNTAQFEEDCIHSSIHLMSSILGSADGIAIKSSKKEDKGKDFTRRIARNLHHLAIYESKMDQVYDPLKGSYHIEEMTNSFAKEAWNKFIA